MTWMATWARRVPAPTGRMVRGFGRGGVVKRDAGGRRDGLDGDGELAQARVIVEVPDGDGGDLLADAADEGRRGERGTAEGEEVGVGVLDGGAQDIDPQLREPRLRRIEAGGLHPDTGQRPRQRLLVHLAGCADRQLVHDTDAGDECGGHGLAEAFMGGIVIKTRRRIIEGDVADEHLLVRTGGLDGDGRVVHVR